jgi:microcompartment protein CcmL/EutN
MKKRTAVAIIEFQDVSVGMAVTDAMLKKAPIAFVRCGTISRGRYLTVIGGTTASVEESVKEARLCGGEGILDQVVLPDVHPHVYEAILGRRRTDGKGALAIIETDTVSSSIRAAEVALKGTPVELVELRLADRGLSGKGVSVYQGELHDVEAAVHMVLDALSQSRAGTRFRIISAPHEALVDQIKHSTHFAETALLELDGEAG